MGCFAQAPTAEKICDATFTRSIVDWLNCKEIEGSILFAAWISLIG